jgi:hypothetical protein
MINPDAQGMTGEIDLSPGERQSVEPSRHVQWLLIALVCAGIVFNNVLRWYPFPAGRSANDISTLDAGLLGIIVNILLYSAVLAVIVLSRSSALRHYGSRPLQLYCLYLALQAPFRAHPMIELVRSGAMIVMLLSADSMAAIAVGSPRYAIRFLHRIWWTLVGTVLIGLVIGLVLQDSVNWGNGLSPSFLEKRRAEFFFFHVLPHFVFALSLAVLVFTMRRPGPQFLVALGMVILLPILAERTMTRTMTFSLIVITLVFLFRYARKALLLAGAVVVVAIVFWPGAMANVAERLRLTEVVSNRSVDVAAGGRSVDIATGGRLFLVLTNLRSFRDAPIFGQGAVETRRRVEASKSVATSEHGYSLHLASSGVFSFLLFAYVIQGLAAAIKIVRFRDHASVPPGIGPYGIAIAAVAMTSFVIGFFWTFSSATAFYEWLTIFFVSAARVTWQMVGPPRD